MKLKRDILNTNKRTIFNQKQFQSEFALDCNTEKNAQNHENKKNKKKLISCLHPRNLLNIFTIVDVLLKYEFKKNFIADMFSGLTGNEFN